MVYNPASPIKSFQVKQKAAEIAKATVKKDNTARSDIAMSVLEQTPAAIALEENRVDEKSIPALETPKAVSKPEEPKPTEEKPLPTSLPASSGLSEPDTVKADKADNVGNFGNLSNRPRQSWAGSMKRLIGRSASVLQSENKLSKQQPSKTQMEISEPVAIPAPLQLKKATSPTEVRVKGRTASKATTNSSPVDRAYDPVNKRFRSSKDYKEEVAPVVISQAHEPRSFLDLDSSSDEDLPVVQRASSVRVARPQIVRHAPKSANQASQQAQKKDADNQSIEKAEKILVEPLVNLYDLSGAEQKGGRIPRDARADALALLEGTADASADGVKQGDASLVPVPDKDDIKSTTIIVADHPGNAEALDVYVSPRGDLASIRASLVPSDTVPELPAKTTLDGLRSNPVTDTEKSLLARTISAPPIPSRNPNRRVTIRPADLIIHHPDHDHKLFRDSIVTTPYPPHLNSPTANKGEKTDDFRSPASKPTISISALPPLPATSKTDRFPSPTSADEHLFLTLTLSRNPFASTTIEIIISSADVTSYDDARLFSDIRSSYNSRLLGIVRRAFCSRTLSHATPGTSDMHLDSVDFIAHLNCPKLGLERKGWLIWLRNQQPLPKRASSLFSSVTSPSDSAHPSMVGGGHHSHHSSLGGGMSNYWSPTSVPRMPFMKSAGRDLPPQIRLHYRFNLLHIFFAVFTVLILSVMSTVLWVLFGYPGLHPGNDALGATLGPTVKASDTWQSDAQLRVLTGLVLGMSVMILGGTGTAAWVAGGWVLL